MQATATACILSWHCCCCRRKLLLDSAVGETCSFMGMKWASLYYVELCLKPPAWVYGVVYAMLKLSAAAGAKCAPKVASHPSLQSKETAASTRRRWLGYGLGSCWFTACLALHVSGVPLNTVPKASDLLQFEERTASMCAAMSLTCFWSLFAVLVSCAVVVVVTPLQVRGGAGSAASSSARRSRLSLGLLTTTVPHCDPPGY